MIHPPQPSYNKKHQHLIGSFKQLYVQLLKPSPLSCARIGGDLVWLQPEDDSEVTDYLVYLAQESWNQKAMGFYCHSLTDQWADSEHSAKWFVQQRRKKWRETRLEFYS